MAGARDDRLEKTRNLMFLLWIGGVGRPVSVGRSVVLGASDVRENIGRPVGLGQLGI